MIRFSSRTALSLAGAITLVAALPAQARNDSFTLPVQAALAARHAHDVVGDLALVFGGASATGADLIAGEVEAQGVAGIVSDDPGKHDHLSDPEVCQRAFEDALARLAGEAHRAGAAAVVGIVSDFKGEHIDDPRNYVCHAGSVKSYVTLRGRLARSYAVASSRRLPPDTGFAALDDVKAVPLSDEGRERYAHFLTLPKPRAFVVYEDGAWRFYSKDPESMTKALDYCARQGRRCWLYAADDRVVWSADVARRIGNSSQLEAASGASPANQ
jgi:uncharacterized protein YbjQ (UPF0145 family)